MRHDSIDFIIAHADDIISYRYTYAMDELIVEFTMRNGEKITKGF